MRTAIPRKYAHLGSLEPRNAVVAAHRLSWIMQPMNYLGATKEHKHMALTAKKQKRNEISFDFKPEKAIEAIVYLASDSERVTNFDKYKAAKLLFLADKFHLVRHGRPIVGDTYWAIKHGPTPGQTLNMIDAVLDAEAKSPSEIQLSSLLVIDRKYKYPRMSAKNTATVECLSRSDLEALNHVMALHGHKTFDELKMLTHKMVAYDKAWSTKPKTSQRAEMSYDDFFEEDSDALAGAREEMIENDLLRKAFPSPVKGSRFQTDPLPCFDGH